MDTLQRRRQRGLTFLEVMVALVILGLALAVVLPEASNWLRNLSVRNTGESIRAGMERARMEALRHNQNMGFWLVTDSGKALTNSCALSASGLSWVVSGVSPAGQCAAAPSRTEAPLLVEAWAGAATGSGITVSALGGDGNAADNVVFNSLGQIQGAGAGSIASIDITSSSAGVRALRVTVNTGGAVRLCDPNVDVNDPAPLLSEVCP